MLTEHSYNRTFHFHFFSQAVNKFLLTSVIVYCFYSFGPSEASAVRDLF